jgi:hypothetical protein
LASDRFRFRGHAIPALDDFKIRQHQIGEARLWRRLKRPVAESEVFPQPIPRPAMGLDQPIQSSKNLTLLVHLVHRVALPV